MGTLLLEYIDTLAPFDDQRRILRDAWMHIAHDAIQFMGSAGGAPPEAGRRLDLTGYLVLPGRINLDHHFFQAQL